MNRKSFNDNWSVYKEGGEARQVTLPHDAMIEEGRSSDAPSGAAGGFFPGGIYVYEKTFTAPAEWANQHVFIEFEGVYQNAKVAVNGHDAGGCAYGYSPFIVVLDEYLHRSGVCIGSRYTEKSPLATLLAASLNLRIGLSNFLMLWR